MVRVNNIKLTPCEKFRFNDTIDKGLSDVVKNEIKRLLIKKLRIPEDRLLDFQIYKQSIDARNREDVKVVFSIDARVKDEKGFLRKNRDKDIISVYSDNPAIKNEYPNKIIIGSNKKIIIVGAGPAGLMCALRLAEQGLNPVVLERGEDVDKRLRTVSDFWQGKPLNPRSNVQFGEGGAGTFSDGKLNTMVKDKDGYMKDVYRIFVENGADESILYKNKPHVGTDRLTQIVKSMRKKIIELGGEVRFNSKVSELLLDNENRNKSVKGIKLENGDILDCDMLVLALGHSARDTFEMLVEKGIFMEPKPFAIGVRVQHPKSFIDRNQYGSFAEYLPSADYKLTYTRLDRRSVYSFCMCPGGYVVNASSEENRLAVNGMSYSGRDGSSSNSAVVISVSPSDFPGQDTLAGMRLQRKLEEDAYRVCSGKIPVQELAEFVRSYYRQHCEEACSKDGIDEYIKKTCSSEEYFEKQLPQCKGLWEYGDLNGFLPEFIKEPMLEAFPEFGKSIKGFNSCNTLLLGLESRTSSPVRICRGENLQSINTEGLYPCGEGAGYAGGITSAAMDGLKVADEIIKSIGDKI